MTARDDKRREVTSEDVLNMTLPKLQALYDELAEARFRPIGDNHHNALACPYCTPSHVAPKYATPPFSEADRIRQQGPQAVSAPSTTPRTDLTLPEKKLAYDTASHYFSMQGKYSGSDAHEQCRLAIVAALKDAFMPSAIERFTPPGVLPRYAAPFKMMGDKTEWVQVRFVPREAIKDKPTEANPSPIRIIVVGDLERAQPSAVAGFAEFGEPCASCGTPAPGPCEAADCIRRTDGGKQT